MFSSVVSPAMPNFHQEHSFLVTSKTLIMHDQCLVPTKGRSIRARRNDHIYPNLEMVLCCSSNNMLGIIPLRCWRQIAPSDDTFGPNDYENWLIAAHIVVKPINY